MCCVGGETQHHSGLSKGEGTEGVQPVLAEGRRGRQPGPSPGGLVGGGVNLNAGETPEDAEQEGDVISLTCKGPARLHLQTAFV